MVGVFHMFNKIDMNKLVKDATSPKRMRDLRWSMNFRPTEQEVLVRRVQLHVDENPLEVVQLDLNEVSAVELLKGYNDNDCNEAGN